MQARALALPTAPVQESGATLQTPLAFFDPATSSWRTSAPSLFEDSTELPLTLPSWVMRDAHALYERPMSERHIVGNDCSSLLVTPTSNLGTNGGSQTPAKRKAGGHGPTLADQVEHL